MIRVCRVAALSAFVIAGFNFVILAVLGQYDFRLGPIHLVATYLFKPLLYLNGAFLLWLALQARQESGRVEIHQRPSFKPHWLFWIVSAALLIAVYAISFQVNLDFEDWTHRPLTTGVPPWSFFIHKQYDGFYRPLGFVSLWLDNEVFGAALWGYHIQSFLVQLLNGYLMARLGFRLGLSARESMWAGIAFVILPCSFEAVIWPGARFDLLTATFLLLALERALAGSVWVSTAAYCLGVLSKEAAYAYPLLLVALFVLRRQLGLSLPSERWRKLFYATVPVTVALLFIRVAIYGNLGGYPDEKTHGTINFAFNWHTITSMVTRVPAALFLINTGAGLPVWLKVTLIAYVTLLAAIVFQKGAAGRHTWLIVLAFVAAAPAANMIAWMTQWAQQGRYVSHSAVWIVFLLLWTLRSVRFSSVLLPLWMAVLAAAAFFNTLPYVRMMGVIREATRQAAAACRDLNCQALVLEDLPRDYEGAFYFRYQVLHDVQAALPAVPVGTENRPGAVVLRWTDACRWAQESAHSTLRMNDSGRAGKRVRYAPAAS